MWILWCFFIVSRNKLFDKTPLIWDTMTMIAPEPEINVKNKPRYNISYLNDFEAIGWFYYVS